MTTHFIANVPGATPQPLRTNVAPGELTKPELESVINEHLTKPASRLVDRINGVADKQASIRADIAEVAADQKARGIYREPQTTVVNQRQYSAPQDTLPD